MARTWTEEQCAAIDARSHTVLLSAAAGSGKTATLTERLIRMITDKEKPLDVSRMLIVTFTRAAAKELRDRIANALSDALEKEPNDRHLLRSILLLPNAKIRTIDSFCNDLVKGHTERLSIPSRYRIPDAAETELLTHDIMDELVEDAFTGSFAPEGLDVAYLTECTAEARNEKDLIPLLCRLYEKLGGFPGGVSLLEAQATTMRENIGKPFFETAHGKEIQDFCLKTFADCRESLLSAQKQAVEANDTYYISHVSGAVTASAVCMDTLREACKNGYGALQTLLAQELPTPKRTTDDKLSDAGLRAKQYLAHLRKELKKIRETYFCWQEQDILYAVEQHAVLQQSVALLLREFDRRYTEEKRKRGLCTYNDLEHFAFRLLVEKESGADGKIVPTALAKELQGTFDAICIDEYQDVNHLQHSIFEAIATPTNRFMVGDIKQSIYGFRGAVPKIFSDMRSGTPTPDAPQNSAVLYLTRNFRSHGHLIDFNNGVFDYLFGTLGESIGYRKEDRLQTGKAAPEKPLPLPEITYLQTGRTVSDDEEDDGASVGEWDVIAEKIRTLLQNGTPPSDIAVLCRDGRSCAAAAECFAGYGIPVLAEDKQNFFLHPEILLAVCLLQTVNNPRRDIYLAGLLRSPLYRFRLEDLIRIRKSAEPSVPLYDALTEYTAKNPAFAKGKRFLRDLTEFRREEKGTPADKMCRFLFEKTALYAHTDAMGARRLRILYDCARTYEANAFHGLYRFVAYLSELMENGASPASLRAAGGADGVSLITVHHSKGLEYPVCFLANTAPPKKIVRDTMLFHPRLGLGFFVRDDSGHALLNNPLRCAVKQALEQDACEEEVRVLYVALTRASEQLYISAHSTTSSENRLLKAALLRTFPTVTMLRDASFFDWILAAVGNRADLCRIHMDGVSVPETAFESLPAKEAVPTEEDGETASPEAWEDVYRKRFAFVYPHADESALPGKVSVSKLYPGFLDKTEEAPSDAADAEKPFFHAASDPDEPQTKTPRAPTFLSGTEENRSAKAGIATHLFLQFCRFDGILHTNSLQNEAKKQIEEELAYLTDSGFMRAEDAARVRKDELIAFAQSPLAARIANAKRLWREFRFNVMLPASLFTEDETRYRESEIFTQGVIDLLFETEEGELILVDYKTDRLSRAMLQDDSSARDFLFARHQTQLTYYAHAIEKIFGKKPKEAAVYSLHAAKLFSFVP